MDKYKESEEYYLMVLKDYSIDGKTSAKYVHCLESQARHCPKTKQLEYAIRACEAYAAYGEEPLRYGDCLKCLADLYKPDNPKEAQKYYLMAVQAYERDEKYFGYGDCLLSLAELLNAQYHYKEAEEYCERACQMYAIDSDKDSEYARCLFLMAKFHGAHGREEAEQECYLKAYKLDGCALSKLEDMARRYYYMHKYDKSEMYAVKYCQRSCVTRQKWFRIFYK